MQEHSANDKIVDSVRDYWNSHPLGVQYLKDPSIRVGTPEFFDHVRPWMSPFKFPWIMERIEQAAAHLKGRRLLEIGCGLGFVTAEFIRRGVQVTAVDLSPVAIELTRRHLQIRGLAAADVRVENALKLAFPDDSFDAVWSNGVLHHTGDTATAIREVHRVLRPGGRAIISHFYRRPSWMYWISRLGRENIEYKDEDPPVTDFMSETQVLSMFDAFRVEQTFREHHRALPIARTGVKAALYTYAFRPVYNLIPDRMARQLAYKFSVIAVKR